MFVYYFIASLSLLTRCKICENTVKKSKIDALLLIFQSCPVGLIGVFAGPILAP